MSDRQVVLHFEEPQPRRLDKFLVACLPEFSRSRLQGLIKEGLVMVDALPAHKSGKMLEGGETIRVTIPPPEPSELVAEDIPLDVIFENQDILVVNKPAGMVVHPAAGHRSGTLVHAALAHAPDIEGIGGVQRPGVVHRLDKDTSGLILLAKNDRSHRWLQNQFSARKVEKTYLAVVDGAPPTPRGRIEAPIGRDTRQRQSMAILPPGKGRAAVTEYYTRQSFAEHTYLEVHPITGRTHQIRVHLAFINCPIVGDRVYGRRHPSLPLGRHFLHAFSLAIRLPGEEDATTFEAPLPEELEKVLDELNQQSKL
ncbi:MAG TPA: RluA family pseudouridine synthase [Anaerolineales bacterium]